MYLDELKNRMKERGVTRTRLAKMAGMDYTSLCNRLNGNTDFKVGELLDVCAQLHIRINDLDFD